MGASTLHFLSVTTPTLATKLTPLNPFSNNTPISYKPFFPTKQLSLKSTTLFSFPRFIRHVAVSSEFEQEEEEEEEERFSEDLKLFVGNLPFSVDSATLAGFFEKAGNVQRVEVIYDKLTGRSRGFGFVTMSTIEEVESAAEQFNGYEIEGRALRVNAGPPPPKIESPFRTPRSVGGATNFDNNNKVYVGNLSWGVDDLALKTLFSEQGQVMEARVIYDRDSGRSKGFGFVTYNSAEEVNNAIESLDGLDLDGRSIRVSVAESRPPRRQF